MKQLYYLIFCLSILTGNKLMASPLEDTIIDVHGIEKSAHLATSALIIEDPDHQLNYQQILFDDSLKKHFFKPKSDIPYMDFTQSSYWMKLSLKNDSSAQKSVYIELARPLTNVVNLYVFDKDKNLIKVYLAGDALPFKKRPYLHRKFIFPIDLPAKSERTFVVQSRSDGEILKLPFRIWDVETFTQFISSENFFLGGYYGLFVIVIILFSFFGLALRQKLYLFFVSYVFILGLFQLALDGLAYKYFWSGVPWLGNHAILMLAALSMTFMLTYVKSFLQFDKKHKKYLIGYNAFIVLIIISFFLSMSSGILLAISYPLLNGLSFITILYILYGLYLKYKSDDKPNITVLMAFIGLVSGAILFILSNVNIINSEFLATNALKLGSATEVLFLSIALAARYRQTQLEKIEAQDAAFKRLEEINTLKNEQNERLEAQVKERTEEISRQNDILSTQNKEIINSITYAKRLQDAILPAASTLEKHLPEHGIVYLPKDIVSGDFYWIETTEDHVYFAVADCTGHGVPGAMVSVVGYNSLNRCIRELNLSDPGEILDNLTEMVEETFSKKKTEVSDGMDISLCVWDKKDQLRFAGAYNPLYLLRDGEIIVTKGDKQPIGKFISRSKFTTHQVNLKKDDAIYLFSDGYADQFGGPRGKKLKYSNFKEYLIELNHLDGKSMEDELIERFHKWRGENEQIDDVCVMKVKF